MLAEPTTAPLPAPTFSTQLTPREREVLALLAAGLCFDDAADVLVVSRHTIKAHAHNIRLKLGARNAAHAVYLALMLGKSSTSVL